MKVKELIKKINHSEEPIYSLWDAEDFLFDEDIEKVASGLELDQHRWYSNATDVYKCEDGFVGITGPYQLFSEIDSWLDVAVECVAEEYEEVKTVTYKPIR